MEHYSAMPLLSFGHSVLLFVILMINVVLDWQHFGLYIKPVNEDLHTRLIFFAVTNTYSSELEDCGFIRKKYR